MYYSKSTGVPDAQGDEHGQTQFSIMSNACDPKFLCYRQHANLQDTWTQQALRANI